jgi:phosphoglycolate phosphatase-like HAD superfamily hydrolase
VPRLLLFDIDNTLLWSGGAGALAMRLAFRDSFGIDDGFKGVEFSGRTDSHILAEALRKHAIGGGYAQHEDNFRERYYNHLPQALREGRGKLMPGFPMLLEDLSRRSGIHLGLATGNFSRAAQFKLAHYGIDGFFTGGAFGEESKDRSVIVRRALERLAEGLSPAEATVIGDTPHDISSAKACGTIAAGVATGRSTLDDLRRCGADLVFEDFSDWRRAAAILTAEA